MRRWRWALAVVLALALGALAVSGIVTMKMPGKSHTGGAPPLTDGERATAAELQRLVAALAGDVGERNVGRPVALARAAQLIADELERMGYQVSRQPFRTGDTLTENLVVELRGARLPDEIVVVGAHYDSAPGTPGANDNASGTAALLALARVFVRQRPDITLRFVAFVNEEAPFFQTPSMGSLVYARSCKDRGEKVTAMLSLETIGHYSAAPDSQRYPFPFSAFYPSTGNFIGFVGNVASRALVRRTVGSFRRHAPFPSEGAAVPGGIPGVGWSDHWAFWQMGYPAVMVTDTALYRYPHYHLASDTPDRLDYPSTARVVVGLAAVIGDLVAAP
jgi:hypothetical protein